MFCPRALARRALSAAPLAAATEQRDRTRTARPQRPLRAPRHLLGSGGLFFRALTSGPSRSRWGLSAARRADLKAQRLRSRASQSHGPRSSGPDQVALGRQPPLRMHPLLVASPYRRAKTSKSQPPTSSWGEGRNCMGRVAWRARRMATCMCTEVACLLCSAARSFDAPLAPHTVAHQPMTWAPHRGRQ